MILEKNYRITNGKDSISCLCAYDSEDTVRKAVIFTHGFSSSKNGHSAVLFRKTALSEFRDFVFVGFDWPGHGDSKEVSLRLDACVRYLDAVIADTKERFQAEEIYIHGTSFGGYMPLKYILEKGFPFELAALRCPAVDMAETFASSLATTEQLEKLRRGETVPVGLTDTVDVTMGFLEDLKKTDLIHADFRAYEGRIYFIQGTEDELVSCKTVREFARKNRILLDEVEGADHRFLNDAMMRYAILATAEYFGLEKR